MTQKIEFTAEKDRQLDDLIEKFKSDNFIDLRNT